MVVVVSIQQQSLQQQQQQKCLYVKSPTYEWRVGYGDVIEEPSGQHSVHPAALNAQWDPPFLAHSHTWREDDPGDIQRLLFL